MASNAFQFTDAAKEDLDNTLSYISKELCNPIAAKNLFEKIEKKIDMICDFPESCPVVENEFVVRKDIRKSIVDNYIIYYIFEEDKKIISILRIVYGRRNLDEILKLI